MTSAETRHEPRSLVRIYLLLLLATVLWGGSQVAGKLAIREIPPMTAGVLRYGVSSLVLLALFGGRLPSWPTLSRGDRWNLVGLGILGTFLNHICSYAGLYMAPASHAAILGPTSSPICTLALAARFAEERLTRGQVGGMMLCLVGVMLVARPGGPSAAMGGTILVGDLLLVLSGLAWGAYSFLTKIAMRRVSAEAALVYGMVIGTVLLVPVGMMERPWGALAGASALSWASLLYVTLACTVLASFWWSLAIQRVGAGRTAVFGNLPPVVGVLLSWWVLGDRLTGTQLFGGGLTLAGIWVCQGPGAMQAAWRETRLRLGEVVVAKPKR
ncbi:MAG TPA: DMT family transporter [Candidatus Acidoferrum sp.]|nr:DMT family transporter [Candidatus Acidoferrum sp.]